MWEKVLLLLAGSAFGSASAILGAWLNDLRTEKRRKRAKLEEAYIAWLNADTLVRDRLKELVQFVESEEKVAESEELLVEKLERLPADLQTLCSALNTAFVYERSRPKRRLIELQTSLYAHLIESIKIVIAHHKTHVEYHQTVDSTNTMLSDLEEINAKKLFQNLN